MRASGSIPSFRLLLLLVLTLAMTGICPFLFAAEEAPPAAVLAVVAGDVVVRRGDMTMDGSFGASLQDGDIVITGDDAEAAVLFDSGQIIELGPGSRITVAAVAAEQPESAETAQASAALSGNLHRFTRGDEDAQARAALPTLRGYHEAELDPVAPRNSLVSPYPIRFEWTPVENALEYRLVLTGPDGSSQTHRSVDPFVDEPEGIGWFSGGGQWTWKVEAVTPESTMESEEVVFEFAPAETWKELENFAERLNALRRADGTKADAALYLLGGYMRSSGFYADAIQHLEQLVDRYPDRGELHQELGALYQAIGRNDKAAEAYRSALKE